MSDVEAPLPPEEPEAAPEAEPQPAEPETPTEEPQATMWRVLARVRYTAGPDEFFAGPGELIDSDAAAQCDPEAVTPDAEG